MCISQLKKGDKDTSEQSKDNEDNYRTYSIISYFVVLIVIGLPIWWYTTRVYRANLPLEQMQKVSFNNYTDKEFGTPLSLEYDILVTFVHPDPVNPKILIKGEEIESNLLLYLNKISSISKFVIKSQWLFLQDLGIVPTKKADHYVLKKEQLPHVITPLEAKLWSHLSPRPTINLLVYFQRCNDFPLYIFDDIKKVDSNAFMSPRWGGIYIINPDENSCKSSVFQPNIQLITSTFVTQIQRLFNIDNILDDDNIYELKMRKSREMVESTRRTLKSLSELLSEIKSIVISEDVGDKIRVAVLNADLAEDLLNKGEVDEGLEAAKIAYKNSEEAFSDPSLLSLLYFPEDQKYAVYIPLFLPIMIPVIMSLPTLKTWIRNKNNGVKIKNN